MTKTYIDERVADTSKTLDHIADTSKKASLTEQYKTRTLQNDFYYFDNGKTQYIVEYHNIKGFEGLDGVKVLECVPSYEKWQSLNELLDSMNDTNKALAHRLNICKELLKECKNLINECIRGDYKNELCERIDEVLK